MHHLAFAKDLLKMTSEQKQRLQRTLERMISEDEDAKLMLGNRGFAPQNTTTLTAAIKATPTLPPAFARAALTQRKAAPHREFVIRTQVALEEKRIQALSNPDTAKALGKKMRQEFSTL